VGGGAAHWVGLAFDLPFDEHWTSLLLLLLLLFSPWLSVDFGYFLRNTASMLSDQ